ncbi:L-2-hydroxyglutarate oxidase, partial [Streptomyces sp. SID7803]|nr:L-2-hydroxyglutarate oxidase [Streptomyces sp. SID7803]
MARELTARGGPRHTLREGRTVGVRTRLATIRKSPTPASTTLLDLPSTPGSAGNRSIVAYAKDHGVAVKECGKLIVATAPSELARLEELAARAAANGVPAR